MLVKSGATSVTTYFVLRDSTNHLPHTTLTVTDIDLYYTEFRLLESAKIDCTSIAADAAYTSGGAAHCGHGVYRIDWPNLAFDGAIGTTVQLIVVCSGADTTFLEVELSAPTDSVAIGSSATAASNANSAFTGGVYNVGAGGIVAASVTGAVGSVTGAVGSVTGAVGSVTGNVGGNVIGNVAGVTGNVSGSVGSIATNGITSGSIATDAIGASELAADAVTEIATGVWAAAARTLTAATNITSTGGTTVPQTGDAYARIGAAGVSLTAIPYNTAWDTPIKTKAEEALRTYDLDHLSNAGSAPAPTSGSFMDKLMNKTAGGVTYDQTTDSLEALKDNSVTVADLQDAMFGGARPTGAVVDDVLNSATTFKTDRTEATNDHWNYSYLLFTAGSLAGQVRRITGYNGTTKFVTCDAFTAEPTAVTDTFILVNI